MIESTTYEKNWIKLAFWVILSVAFLVKPIALRMEGAISQRFLSFDR